MGNLTLNRSNLNYLAFCKHTQTALSTLHIYLFARWSISWLETCMVHDFIYSFIYIIGLGVFN